MKRMNLLVGLMATISLAMLVAGNGYCPEDHRQSYYHGRWCCATEFEKNCGLGDQCNGGKIGFNSTCCENDNFVPCIEPPCMDFGIRKCYSSQIEFPCIIPETTVGGTDVNFLTLKDIKVIGALGDSITAGANMLLRQFPGDPLLIDYRYATFLMGGDPSYTTLPNLILKYNKNLTGYSTKDDKGYNFAVTGAFTTDLMEQARQMINETMIHKDVWKMINILIGHNDFCSFSCHPIYNVKLMVSRVIDVISEIKAHLPKSFVNVLAPLDVTSAIHYYNNFGSYNPKCKISLPLSCGCFFEDIVKIELKEMQKNQDEYYQLLLKAIKKKRFDTKDFAVVLHSFGMNININQTLELFAPDCFHPTAIAHKELAVAMFNSLFTDVEARESSTTSPIALKCPEKTRSPFLRTTKNSRSGERGVMYGLTGTFDPTKINCAG